MSSHNLNPPPIGPFQRNHIKSVTILISRRKNIHLLITTTRLQILNQKIPPLLRLRIYIHIARRINNPSKKLKSNTPRNNRLRLTENPLKLVRILYIPTQKSIYIPLRPNCHSQVLRTQLKSQTASYIKTKQHPFPNISANAHSLFKSRHLKIKSH